LGNGHSVSGSCSSLGNGDLLVLENNSHPPTTQPSTSDLQSPPSSHVRIIVTDTGKGISPDFLPHVFDRFRQADSTTTRAHGGLGLGLAIVRNLVELHGGTVWAESTGEGQGATFIVELPLLPNSNQQQREHSCSLLLDHSNALAGLRVLIVDDEADTREFLATALEQFHMVVTMAASAPEAFDLLQQHPPDILLSDIGMPEEDGYSLIQKIRALPPEAGGQIPAAALTAYVQGDDRLQALQAGFQMHIPKPIEPIQLVDVIARLVGRRGNERTGEGGEVLGFRF
jgi:CheY-like chemotaxis protein